MFCQGSDLTGLDHMLAHHVHCIFITQTVPDSIASYDNKFIFWVTAVHCDFWLTCDRLLLVVLCLVRFVLEITESS